MDYQIIQKLQELNRELNYKLNKNVGVVLVKEYHIYKTNLGAFDYHIEVQIIALSGYVKRFTFPSERAFENAINYMKQNGISELRKLRQFTI